MSGVYANAVQNHSLLEFSSLSEETRSAGLEAVAPVRGEQLTVLFRLLVQARENEFGGLTNNELVRLSGFRINAVTARIMELRRVEIGKSRDCLVEAFGKKVDAVTGVQNVVWRVNPVYFEPSREVV